MERTKRKSSVYNDYVPYGGRVPNFKEKEGMKLKKEQFDVTGMTCSACSARIEKSVSKLPGIKEVSVNLLKNSMVASYDESILDTSGIIQAVEKAGYGAIPKTLAQSGSKPAVAAGKPEISTAQKDYKQMKQRLLLSAVFTMTGIERKDLLSAPDYELVMEEVAEQLEAWEVSRIYVWGPDKYVIQRDLLEYRKDISKRTRKIVNRILRMIKDIEGTYSAKLDLQSAGIGSLKIICGLGTEVSHNALDDAVDLKNIIRHIDLKGCSEHMLQIMKKYTSEKEVYYRLRRFREKWDDVSEGIQEKSLSLLKELGKVDTVEARALRDDLLVMCTGEAMAFPTLEEYIQKENAKTGKVIRDKNDK